MRCHLHFLTGRAEERLTFDLQRQIAERLGYADRGGLPAVERFMKHYFLVAKDVGDLTAIVCAALEERHAKPRADARPPASGGFRRRGRAIAETNGLRRRQRPPQRRATTTSSSAIRSTSSGSSGSPTSTTWPSTPTPRGSSRGRCKLIDAALRDDPEANRLFLEILTSRNAPEIGAAAHERGRRARPLHPRFRPRRRR